MSAISDMNSKELRLLIEEIFNQADMNMMLSYELKERLKFEGTKQAWGGICFRLSREKILAKDDSKPLRIGKQTFKYYRLLPESVEEQKVNKSKEDLYLIFNETTQESERITGKFDLTKRVESLLAGTNHELSIFKLVSKAKNAPKFEDV